MKRRRPSPEDNCPNKIARRTKPISVPEESLFQNIPDDIVAEIFLRLLILPLKCRVDFYPQVFIMASQLAMVNQQFYRCLRTWFLLEKEAKILKAACALFPLSSLVLGKRFLLSCLVERVPIATFARPNPSAIDTTKYLDFKSINLRVDNGERHHCDDFARLFELFLELKENVWKIRDNCSLKRYKLSQAYFSVIFPLSGNLNMTIRNICLPIVISLSLKRFFIWYLDNPPLNPSLRLYDLARSITDPRPDTQNQSRRSDVVHGRMPPMLKDDEADNDLTKESGGILTSANAKIRRMYFGQIFQLIAKEGSMELLTIFLEKIDDLACKDILDALYLACKNGSNHVTFCLLDLFWAVSHGSKPENIMVKDASIFWLSEKLLQTTLNICLRLAVESNDESLALILTDKYKATPSLILFNHLYCIVRNNNFTLFRLCSPPFMPLDDIHALYLCAISVKSRTFVDFFVVTEPQLISKDTPSFDGLKEAIKTKDISWVSYIYNLYPVESRTINNVGFLTSIKCGNYLLVRKFYHLGVDIDDDDSPSPDPCSFKSHVVVGKLYFHSLISEAILARQPSILKFLFSIMTDPQRLLLSQIDLDGSTFRLTTQAAIFGRPLK